MTINGELTSLLALFDDEDKYVREAVLTRLLQDGEQSVVDISELASAESDLLLRSRYTELTDILKRELIFKKFKNLIEEGSLTLEDGMNILSSLPGSDYNKDITEPFDSDILELLTEISGDRTDIENVEIFNHIFFKRLSFNFTSAYDFSLKNTLFHEVIKTRRGNPVVVSILYFLYASRAGLNIFPLTFPGGFIPVLLNNNGKILFYLNIYKGGDIFLEDDLKKYFEDSELKFDSSVLKVKGDYYLIAVFAEITRMCFLKLGKTENAELLKKMVNILGEEILQ